jgi:VIT1/CCC1 family predicted Fe2+/Mn2+ transporter
MLEILRGRVKRVLDPVDRVSEALFGLIMVLSITCSLSIAEAGRSEVRSMLISALGCSVAWGIVDAVMYLLARFSEQGRNILALRSLRTAADDAEAQGVIADALPPLIASVVQPVELKELRSRLTTLPEPPARPRLTNDDWLGAAGVFLIVVLATLPVAIPFLFITDPGVALRASNAVALAMLAVMGFKLGSYAGYPSVRMGLWMVLLGIALVAITIALGG